jgi:hypothetical protein
MTYVPRANLSRYSFIICVSTSTRITVIVTSCSKTDRDLGYKFLDSSMVVFGGTPDSALVQLIHPREMDRGKPGMVYPYVSSLYSVKCHPVLRLQISSTRGKIRN